MMLGALRNRDFRLFWIGAFVSNIGSWIQSIALNWLVLDLTGSPLALGIVSFTSTAPVLALSLFGGVFADRHDRRRLLLVTQSLLLLLALVLTAITLPGLVRIEHIILISLLTGIVTAINGPAWQAFIVDLVEPRDLPTAIALNSTQFNLSRVAGPSIAGVLLAAIGAAGCFFINSLSFVAVVAALLVVRPRSMSVRHGMGGLWKTLRAGIGYAVGQPVVSTVFVLTSIMTVFGFPYAVLMPVMAQAVLGLDASGYGAMMAATGVGAIIGSLAAAWWGSRVPRGKLLIAAELGFAVSVLGFSLARILAASLACLVFLGFFMIVYLTNANTIIQLLVPDDLRGRVMSIWTLVSFGLTPIGSLLAGAIAQIQSAPLALGIGGLICGGAAIVIALTRPPLRAVPAGTRLTVAGEPPVARTGKPATFSPGPPD
ncbi:MAG: MFS transporter [Chloroflexi bacterium]|nr:MFS transporter [Chloroflexota bacterium]